MEAAGSHAVQQWLRQKKKDQDEKLEVCCITSKSRLVNFSHITSKHARKCIAWYNARMDERNQARDKVLVKRKKEFVLQLLLSTISHDL